ncbi:hypothetical protein CTI12_AA476260 [Artemisia annua]|uniref:Uncharacterized protein n=1 Tax=Artemisia annua TaxID=35608 RepID=A0A2U1LM77_ARTAN|nr:hypothetical protein CTI12_AA476260 [Artemisia annua]
MSFHDKGFWMGKGDGHITNREALVGNSSLVESKRSHQWFADATEAEFFPNKRQAIESPNDKPISEISTSHLSWDNVSALESSPSQFIDRLLGSPVRMDNGHVNRKIGHDQLGNGSLVGLSMSYSIEDPETCVNYGGVRKVKVNQVKNTDSRASETNFITMGPNFGNEDGNVTLMGHSYSGFHPAHTSTGDPAVEKDDENHISIINSISFGGFHDEPEIDTLARPIDSYFVKPMNNYGASFDQSADKTLRSPKIKAMDASNLSTVGTAQQGVKSKSKSEPKQAKKEAPNSFPSNVRSLMATGILDGVPVKYVSVSREELRGIIKGSGYLCSCQSCNHSKVSYFFCLLFNSRIKMSFVFYKANAEFPKYVILLISWMSCYHFGNNSCKSCFSAAVKTSFIKLDFFLSFFSLRHLMLMSLSVMLDAKQSTQTIIYTLRAERQYIK